MNYIKDTVIETGRIILYYIIKMALIIVEEILFFCSRIPKIYSCTTCFFGFVFSISFITKGYIIDAIKNLLLFIVMSFFVYFLFVLIMKPLNNIIFKSLEFIRNSHHNINCGIYMEKYKLKLLYETDIDKMLVFKELLETNILLSGLKLKAKLIFDDNNNIDYKKILSNGLSTANALCFSPNANVNSFIEQNKEFVIENDAFIKDFKNFYENNKDINDQIIFLKNNIKKIKSSKK